MSRVAVWSGLVLTVLALWAPRAIWEQGHEQDGRWGLLGYRASPDRPGATLVAQFRSAELGATVALTAAAVAAVVVLLRNLEERDRARSRQQTRALLAQAIRPANANSSSTLGGAYGSDSGMYAPGPELTAARR